MATRRRWLQFSLRGFIVVLTIGCVWLGWKIEKAHKRGQAIDALVSAGGIVYCYRHYQTPGMPNSAGRFRNLQLARPWADFRGYRVRVTLGVGTQLNDAVGDLLGRIDGIHQIVVSNRTCRDSDLRHLYRLDDGCEIILQSPLLTQAGIRELQRRLPKSEVVYWINNDTASPAAKRILK